MADKKKNNKELNKIATLPKDAIEKLKNYFNKSWATLKIKNSNEKKD